MSAFHFKELSIQPALGDSIELREPGTSTPITGQIKDVSGGNLANPFLVSAAGVEGDWAFVAPVDVPYDVYWADGDDVIGKSQEELKPNNISDANALALTDGGETTLHSHAGGGGGGEWELVETQEVVVSAESELVFDNGGAGLDFALYRYKLIGCIKAITSASNTRWYAVEANAAAVVTSDYASNRSYVTTSHVDSQIGRNVIGVNNNNALTYFEFTGGMFFRRNLEGRIDMDNVDYAAFSPGFTTILGLRTNSYNINSIAAATHIGIYNSAGAYLDVGTKLKLWRTAV